VLDRYHVVFQVEVIKLVTRHTPRFRNALAILSYGGRYGGFLALYSCKHSVANRCHACPITTALIDEVLLYLLLGMATFLYPVGIYADIKVLNQSYAWESTLPCERVGRAISSFQLLK
jgi:hypothetical protein